MSPYLSLKNGWKKIMRYKIQYRVSSHWFDFIIGYPNEFDDKKAAIQHCISESFNRPHNILRIWDNEAENEIQSEVSDYIFMDGRVYKGYHEELK